MSQEEFPGFLFSGRDWGDGFIEIYIYMASQATRLKNPPANAGRAEDMGLNPGSGRSPGG